MTRLLEHVRHMREFADSSESRYVPFRPYADIEDWLDPPLKKEEYAAVATFFRDMDEEKAQRMERVKQEHVAASTAEDLAGDGGADQEDGESEDI